MNRAEFAALGVVLHEYRAIVADMDGCLTTARLIAGPIDHDKAAALEACRIALMQACDVIDGLLAERKPVES